jgi:hypothetical protein
MRLRRFAGVVAALTMSHFVLVTGEVECTRASRSADTPPSHEMTSMDGCAHAASNGDAPLTPPGTPERHTHEHGALCCAALAGCAPVFASDASAHPSVESVRSTRVTPTDSDGVAAPFFPPDPPPPKA